MATTIHRPRSAGRTRYDGLRHLLSQQEVMLRNRRQVLRDGLPSWMSGVMDDEEHSLDAEGQRVGFSVLELTSRTVQGIEAALQRLEAGDFGTCLNCRRPIAGLRLRAVPFAALCLGCQEGQDGPRRPSQGTPELKRAPSGRRPAS
jgi:RNA polymerase-binding transcription factor DksA